MFLSCKKHETVTISNYAVMKYDVQMVSVITYMSLHSCKEHTIRTRSIINLFITKAIHYVSFSSKNDTYLGHGHEKLSKSDFNEIIRVTGALFIQRNLNL